MHAENFAFWVTQNSKVKNSRVWFAVLNKQNTRHAKAFSTCKLSGSRILPYIVHAIYASKNVMTLCASETFFLLRSFQIDVFVRNPEMHCFSNCPFLRTMFLSFAKKVIIVLVVSMLVQLNKYCSMININKTVIKTVSTSHRIKFAGVKC